jgi:glucokinase
MPATSCLLADLGGTNVRFALVDPLRPNPLAGCAVGKFRVADFPDFASAAQRFLAAGEATPRHGVLAVAGPVAGDRARMTNHPWVVSRRELMARLGLADLLLVNDFAAMGMAVTLLEAGDLHPLGASPLAPVVAGEARSVAVLGPGTGLGVGALFWRGGRALPLHSEGGHVGFAPAGEEEIGILRHLARAFGRVSNERLLSGAGLVNIYRALAAMDGAEVGNPAPEDITRGAADGTDRRATRTLEVFCEVLGSVAGDLALAYGAWDGVYLAGGLAPVVLPWLEGGGFRRRFEDKGRYADELARVPTQVITHPQPGLLGAAAFAHEAWGRIGGGG